MFLISVFLNQDNRCLQEIAMLDYIMVCYSYLHQALYQCMVFVFGVSSWYEAKKTRCQNQCHSNTVIRAIFPQIAFLFLGFTFLF